MQITRRTRLSLLAIAAALVSALVLAAPPSQAASGWPQRFDKDGDADHTWATMDKFSASCPESIAETPGSEPAAKQLADTQDTDSFTPGGTVHYVFFDNPNFASTNFNLQDCIATYPAGTFTAADFDADGVLRNVSKSDLTTGATQIDAASLSGIVASNGEIFYSWTAPDDVAPGSWVCNFARDVATGHGGSGNRKTYPVCYQVIQTATPDTPTLTVNEACGVADSYTIPSTTGVVYQVDGVTQASGAHDLGDGASVAIVAVAAPGYVLAPGDWSWSFTGSEVPTCPGGVTPAAPTHAASDDCGVVDTYTIPTTDGVVYLVDDAVVPAGTYDLAAGAVVTITAQAADEQHVLADGATSSWTFTGGDAPTCPTQIAPAAPVRTSSCGAHDTFTVPATNEENPGVTYRVDGVDAAAGSYDLPPATTVNITAVPLDGFTLDPAAVTSWSFTGGQVRSCGGGSDPVPPPTTTVEAPTTTTTTTEPPPTTTTSVPQPVFTAESGEVEPLVIEQPAAPPAELPFTGGDVGALTAVGVAALSAGALLVLGARRRRVGDDLRP